MADNPRILTLQEIKELIPHREPMLMLDSVQDIIDGEGATGVQQISEDDPVFAGHFPGNPIWPGVYLIEAMAQTAAVSCVLGGTVKQGSYVYFGSIGGVRFRKAVRPGDRVLFPVRFIQRRLNVWRYSGQALVDGELAAEAEFSAAIIENTS